MNKWEPALDNRIRPGHMRNNMRTVPKNGRVFSLFGWAAKEKSHVFYRYCRYDLKYNMFVYQENDSQWHPVVDRPVQWHPFIQEMHQCT